MKTFLDQYTGLDWVNLDNFKRESTKTKILDEVVFRLAGKKVCRTQTMNEFLSS